MKERPILMNGAMVRATLDDIKTQTRRIVKLPHQNPLGQWEPMQIGGPDGGRLSNGATIPLQGGIWHTRTGDSLICPHGQPGDRLYVRETYYAFGRWETRFSAKKKRDEWHFVDMTRDTDRLYQFGTESIEPCLRTRDQEILPTWWKRPSIFMLREASRILLEIVSVQVERLQDISEQDAIAEGIIPHVRGGWHWHPHDPSDPEDWHQFGYKTAQYAYESLWQSITGPGSWDANPWVWVVEFRRITQ